MKSKQNPQLALLSRRFFNGILLGIAGSFMGCNDPTSSVTASTSSPGNETAPKAKPEQNIVSIYSWDEYLNTKLLEEFTARTGIEVKLQFYESSDEMVDGLKSEPGAHDIFVCEDGYLTKVAQKRLMKELDKSRLKNWSNLDPQFTDQEFDPKNEFTVPYLWGTTLLAYREDLLPNPPKSWSIVFDPRVKGHVAFLDDRMEGFAAILRTLGVDLENANADVMNKAADSFVSLIRDQDMVLGGDNDMKAQLIDRGSMLAMMYSGDAARIAEENPEIPIKYFIPQEGATVWTDSFCISRDTTRLENAYRFLDFMLEAKSAAESSNFLRYASPNKAATPYIDADLLADETIYPKPELLAKCRYFKLRDIDSQRALNLGWQRVTEAWLTKSGAVHMNDAEKPGETSPAGTPN